MSDRPVPIPLWLARPMSWAYWQAARRHGAWGRARSERLPVPVVSVGNLSVGGTGKTPLVGRLVEALAGAGHAPCVAMRGYRSAASGGESDEAAAYRRAFERLGLDVPVVAQPDRAAGVRALIEGGAGIDCVVLDDGFQHHRLARDLDIVVLDASRSPLEDRLLPAGWLREPLGSLERADAVVLTHVDRAKAGGVERLCGVLGARWPDLAVATSRHVWDGLDVLEVGGLAAEREVGWLRGKRVLAVSAIGNPSGFLDAVRWAVGAEAAQVITLRDHDPYAAATVERVLGTARGMDAVVTTDKDWSKLGRVGAGRWSCAVVRPRLRLVFEEGEGALVARVLGVVGGEG